MDFEKLTVTELKAALFEIEQQVKHLQTLFQQGIQILQTKIKEQQNGHTENIRASENDRDTGKI